MYCQEVFFWKKSQELSLVWSAHFEEEMARKPLKRKPNLSQLPSDALLAASEHLLISSWVIPDSKANMIARPRAAGRSACC